MTVALHPDPSRIGERVALHSLLVPEAVEVSRLAPSFLDAAGAPTGPIAVAHVSRRPVVLTYRNDRVRVDPASQASVRVNGSRLEGPIEIASAALERGAVLELGRHVVLLLHWMSPHGASSAAHGLIGVSDSLHQTRRAVERAAGHAQPVLVTGPSGTGKELVARAIHDASDRRARPYVAVNAATLLPSTAPSELFGHTKGAFTGATESHRGLFGRADGGTLFLDEIGEADPAVQSMLLRTLETGEITPAGGRESRAVDVRIIAATDRDLQGAMAAGAFRLPLYHRLAGDEIALHALSARRDDIIPMFYHFVREDAGEGAPVLDVADARRLLEHPWPGNARELRTVARWYARLTPEEREAGALERRLGTVASLPAPTTTPGTTTGLGVGFDDEALVHALRQHGFHIERTARALGVSKNHLYKRMEQCEHVRKAKDLAADEIHEARGRAGGSLDEVAALLEVSERGLRLRMRELGMQP